MPWIVTGGSSGIDAATATHGRIGALVHCAGILPTGVFDELDMARRLQVVQVPLGGTTCVARAAISHSRSRCESSWRTRAYTSRAATGSSRRRR
jgi:NAD(P)-dependent dehydrogenase (short-subunit alcohol dehydrogenase family)